MKNEFMKTKVTILITLVGILIGAISYWFQPYNQLNVFGVKTRVIWSLGAFFGSLLLYTLLNEKALKIALLVSLGVILAIIFRIIYDTVFWNSTSHNLAPFEVIGCGMVTIPSAFAGAYLAVLIKKITTYFKK